MAQFGADGAARGAPVGVGAGASALVDVVGGGKYRETRKVGEAQPEQARQVAVVRAGRGLHVAHVAGGVLLFQVHVHHVVLLLHVLPQGFAALGGFFVHLELLDGIVGQVVEHDFVVAFVEVLAVEEEVVHLSAVDVDFAVFLELSAGQLADKSVEHGAFGQVEGVGVVHDGVALVKHLDFGGRHHGFAQLAVRFLEFALHGNLDLRHLLDAACYFHGVPVIQRLVALAFQVDAVAGRTRRSVELEEGYPLTIWRVFGLVHLNAVLYRRAVFMISPYFEAHNIFACKIVGDDAGNAFRLFLVFLCPGHRAARAGPQQQADEHDEQRGTLG